MVAPVYVPSDDCTCPFRYCAETIPHRNSDDTPPDPCSLGHRPKILTPQATPSGTIDLTSASDLLSIAMGMDHVAFLRKYYLDPEFHALACVLIDQRSIVIDALTDCCSDDGAREACRLRKHFGEQIDPQLEYDPWEHECGLDDSSEHCAYHPIFDALLPLPTPDAGDQS